MKRSRLAFVALWAAPLFLGVSGARATALSVLQGNKGLIGENGAMPRFGSSNEPTASDRETARGLYESGDRLAKNKDFTAARRDFEAAYALVPVPTTGAALGGVLEALGLFVEARDVYLAVQRMAVVGKRDSAPFAKARKESTSRGNALLARIATLRLAIEGAPAGTPMHVFFDGAEVHPAAVTAPRKVNPGRHAIVVKAAGYVDQVVTATVEAGGKIELSVTLTRAGGGGVAAGVVCPPGTIWDGKSCVSANVACPVGSKWSGQTCVPNDVVLAPVYTPEEVVEPSSCAPGTVYVGPAKFSLGSSEGGDEERPAHMVSVSAVCMDRVEVTVDAYAKCVASGKCTDAGTDPACNGASRGHHPVNCISAKQAADYCGSVQKRLPTEEEWELAARGPGGRRYPWGDAVPSAQVCWQREKSEGTCEAGSLPAGSTPEGILDMTGNVLEWTSSKPCSYADANNCKEGRVVRGGSWYAAQPSGLRTTRRWDWPEITRLPILGVRCASAPKTQ